MPMPMRLVIEHSVIDLSGLPRRRMDEATDLILWGDLYVAQKALDDDGLPLIDLREISRPGCRYVIASRMYRTTHVAAAV